MNRISSPVDAVVPVVGAFAAAPEVNTCIFPPTVKLFAPGSAKYDVPIYTPPVSYPRKNSAKPVEEFVKRLKYPREFADVTFNFRAEIAPNTPYVPVAVYPPSAMRPPLSPSVVLVSRTANVDVCVE